MKGVTSRIFCELDFQLQKLRNTALSSTPIEQNRECTKGLEFGQVSFRRRRVKRNWTPMSPLEPSAQLTRGVRLEHPANEQDCGGALDLACYSYNF